MNHRIPRIAAIAAAAGLAMSATAAVAYEREGTYQQPPAGEAQQAHVSSQQLDQFVDALQEISEIRHEAARDLEATDDMEAAQHVQQRAQELMIEAVENNGLTVEEYNRIAALMGSDPELQERVHSRLEERS